MKLKSDRLRRFFSNNAGMKMLAVVLAALSFYAIRRETGLEFPYDVPLEVVVEPGIAVLEKEPSTLEVTFRGSPEDHQQLERKRIKAVIKPKTVSLSGSESVTVTPRDIKGATGVTVVKIKPPVVTLTFDREAEKPIQVAKPRITGTPLIGHAEVEYDQKLVTLRGPRLRLQGLETVSTEPIDVDGRVESFTRTVRVLSPSDKWVSEIEPGEITVRVKIITEMVSHSWTNVPVLAAKMPGSAVAVRFVPPSVDVILTGRPEVIDTVRTNSMSVFVNCRDTDLLTTNLLPVQVYLPPGSEVRASIDPPGVRAITGEQ
jgi:hypothetical protein